MAGSTAAGSTLAITAAAPATQDATGYNALTYTKVGGVEQIGAFGVSFDPVNFQPLDGPLEKYKGPANNGAVTPAIAVDETDAGQTLLRTAGNDKTQKLYGFRVTRQDGTRRYFQGRVFGFPEGGQGAASMEMANPQIEICTDIVKAPAA